MRLKPKEERVVAKQYILKVFVENEIMVMSGKLKHFCFLDFIIVGYFLSTKIILTIVLFFLRVIN